MDKRLTKICVITFSVCIVVYFLFKACIVYPSEVTNGHIVYDTDTDKIIDLLIEEEKLEKEYIKKCIYLLKPSMKRKKELTDRIANAIMKYKEDLEPRLIVSMMMQESSFNPRAIGGSDIGLMQVNVWYHAKSYKVSVEDLLNPETNIRVALDILQNIYEQRHEKFKNTWFCFFNTSKWVILDENDNEIAGRKIYYRHVMRYYRNLEKVNAK